jgi:hypothetical protein
VTARRLGLSILVLLSISTTAVLGQEKTLPPTNKQTFQCVEYEKPYSGCRPCGIVCPIMCQLYDPDRPLCIRWAHEQSKRQ